MERDIEMLIRQKVMHAERQPLPWKKEQVWMKVNKEMPHGNKRRLYYYAAAACASLLFAAFLYISLSPGSDPMKHSAEKHYPVTPQEKDKTTTTIKDPVVVKKPFIAGSKRKQVITETVNPNVSIVGPEITTLPTPQDTLATAPPLVKVEPEKSKERIRPVIGVFEETEPQQEIVTQKKRKGFRWFKPGVDKSGPFEDQPQTIIARIH